MGLGKDSELQKESVTESSSETIGSYDFETENLAVLIGIAEDNPSFGVVLDTDELFQKKEGEAIMSHVKELVITVDDKEELACLNTQEKTGGQTFGTTTVMENQNSIDGGENLAPLDSQIKEEENSMEDFNPWKEEIGLLEIMLNE